MPRTVELSVPPARVDEVIRLAEKQPGLLGLQLQKGASLKPPGDVITIRILNRNFHDLMRDMARLGVLQQASASLVTTETASIIAPPRNSAIACDSAEASWEEMEIMIAKEGNMTLNALLIMAVAGAIGVAGLLTGAVHLVIAAMLIAPGFEPIVRMSMSLAAASGTWQRGIIDTAKGYAALVAGALLGVLVLRWTGVSSAYMPPSTLFDYWSSIGPSTVFVALIAGAAGAMLVVTNRSVLTAGVMVALALVPTPIIAAFALLEGDFALAGRAGLRWLLEAGLVLLASYAVFGWKRFRIQRRSIAW